MCSLSIYTSSTETLGKVVEEIAEAAGLDPGLPSKVLLARDNRSVICAMCVFVCVRDVVCLKSISVCLLQTER